MITAKIGDHEHKGRLVFLNRKGGPVTSDTIKKVRDVMYRQGCAMAKGKSAQADQSRQLSVSL